MFSLDEIIDDIMLYWLPKAGPSSARLYWEGMQAMRAGGMPSRKVPTPTGISMFRGEQVRLIMRAEAARRLGDAPLDDQLIHSPVSVPICR